MTGNIEKKNPIFNILEKKNTTKSLSSAINTPLRRVTGKVVSLINVYIKSI